MHFTYRPLDDTDYLGDISLDDQEISNNDDQNLFDKNRMRYIQLSLVMGMASNRKNQIR